jgi:hypothetical protein
MLRIFDGNDRAVKPNLPTIPRRWLDARDRTAPKLGSTSFDAARKLVWHVLCSEVCSVESAMSASNVQMPAMIADAPLPIMYLMGGGTT